MNKSQIQMVVLLCGAAVFVGLCLYPPQEQKTLYARRGMPAWENIGHRAAWAQDRYRASRVNAIRLGLELGIVIVVTLATAYALVPLVDQSRPGWLASPPQARRVPSARAADESARTGGRLGEGP